MAEFPKVQQRLFDDIKRAAEAGDEEKLDFLLKQKNPLAVRHDLSTVLGQEVRKNYDSPLDVFKNADALKNTPIEYTDLPENIAGQFTTEGQGKILMPKTSGDISSKQLGTLLHERGHQDDVLRGVVESQPFDKKLLSKTGLDAAEQAFGKHHARGFFEKEALLDVLKNKKLSTLAPLMKVAGPAAAIYGMSQGDVFAADPTGLLQTDELGKGSDVTEMPSEEREKNRRFKKIRQVLGVE